MTMDRLSETEAQTLRFLHDLPRDRRRRRATAVNGGDLRADLVHTLAAHARDRHPHRAWRGPVAHHQRDPLAGICPGRHRHRARQHPGRGAHRARLGSVIEQGPMDDRRSRGRRRALHHRRRDDLVHPARQACTEDSADGGASHYVGVGSGLQAPGICGSRRSARPVRSAVILFESQDPHSSESSRSRPCLARALVHCHRGRCGPARDDHLARRGARRSNDVLACAGGDRAEHGDVGMASRHCRRSFPIAANAMLAVLVRQESRDGPDPSAADAGGTVGPGRYRFAALRRLRVA